MKRLFIFTLISLLIATISGCSGDRNAIEETVNGFFGSISSGDVDALQQFFPAFATLGAAERNAYAQVFSGFNRWEVADITVDGSNAVAKVTAFSETGALTLHLPLTYLEKRWIVAERTSMRADIGTVPAE